MAFLPTLASVPTALHESAHSVAALLRDIPFSQVSIDPNPSQHPANRDGFTTWTAPRGLQPASEAFIYAAPAALAAALNDRPLSAVIREREYADDLPHFARYLPHFGRQWTREISDNLPAVTEMSMRLLMRGSVRPNDPDPLKDPAAIKAFLASPNVARRGPSPSSG